MVAIKQVISEKTKESKIAIPEIQKDAEENETNSIEIPDKLLVAKWISQGGFLAFMLMFFASIMAFVIFFSWIGVTLFLSASEISQEIQKMQINLPETSQEISEKFSSMVKIFDKKFFLNISPEIGTKILSIVTFLIVLMFIFTSVLKTVKACRALRNPTQKISRQFGCILVTNILVFPIILHLSVAIFLPGPEKEILILNFDEIYCEYWIPFVFFLNLILWTFTHIALYCKAKSINQESTKKTQA